MLKEANCYGISMFPIAEGWVKEFLFSFTEFLDVTPKFALWIPSDPFLKWPEALELVFECYLSELIYYSS